MDVFDAHFIGNFGGWRSSRSLRYPLPSLGRPEKQVGLPAQRLPAVMVSDERCIERSTPGGGRETNIT
jgi:hypothetical protein